MKWTQLARVLTLGIATASLASLASLAIAGEHSGGARDQRADDDFAPLTIAVFGEWPYRQVLLDNAHLLQNSVNDADVDLVIHVGDIHSGSMACTSAGILPAIATANPGWNQSVFHAFQQFDAPVIYTPGDNEWADCHKTKQFKSGAPLKELASVRELFFAKPGVTLGGREMRVRSQSRHYDVSFPADSQFVENVRWRKRDVLFATFNMPGGSNDDLSAWSNGFEDAPAHAREIAERQAANLRWLDAAFQRASDERARAVVIVLQADMWDPEALAAGGAGLDKYTPFVKRLATLSLQFRRPVLLLNGDTHLYLTDRPLANPASSTGVTHGTPAVPNLTRIVVQGSTNAPAEWLRLSVDPRSAAVFSWRNVSYCATPLTGCL